MSLDKAIKNGKEKRKPYRGAKAVDSTCRNHGSCKWCESNRKHKFRDKHSIEDFAKDIDVHNKDICEIVWISEDEVSE